MLFRRPLPFLILVGSNGGLGEIKMGSSSSPWTYDQAKDLILVHTKEQISGRMVSSGISDVASASVHSEKTRLKKLMMMMKMILSLLLWTNRKKMMVFSVRQKLWNWGQKSDGRLQIWCSLQVTLHREPPKVGLVEKLTGSLYWWVELCVPTLHRECYRTLWYIYTIVTMEIAMW